jgi:Tol biopolymer transport system component
MPVVASDGKTLAFTNTRGDNAGIFTADLTSSNTDRSEGLVMSAERKTPVQFTPDRTSLLYYAFAQGGSQRLWLLPLADKADSMPLSQGTSNEIQGRLSPDGRWLAYAGDESGRWEVYVQAFPNPSTRMTVSTGGGAEPYWRGDGRELYYLADDRALMAVAVTPGARLQLGRPHALFRPRVVGEPSTYRSHFVPTADGQRFLIDVLRDPSLDPVNVLVNWARPGRNR